VDAVRPGRLKAAAVRARRSGGGVRAASLLAASLIAIVVAGGVNGATGGWTIARTPASVVAGVSTAIGITATNVAGGSTVGCVRLQVPAAFTVDAVGVDSVQPSHAWTADAPTAGPSGSTIVSVHGVTEGDVLKNDGDVVDFHVTVTGTAVGSYAWPAESRDHANCSSGIDTASITVSITGGAATPTPVPTPTATPTPRPTATPTRPPSPTPVPTPTPRPTATPTPTAVPSPTPAVTPSPAPTATVSPTPEPTATASMEPSPSASPSDSPSPTPTGSEPGSTSGPGAASGGATGSPSGGSSPAGDGSTAAGGYVVGLDPASQGDLTLTTSAMASLDGIVWAVPSLVLTVPGLLLVLAVLAQAAAGAAWLPVVRRKVGSFFQGPR
jgi:hypothetical protein